MFVVAVRSIFDVFTLSIINYCITVSLCAGCALAGSIAALIGLWMPIWSICGHEDEDFALTAGSVALKLIPFWCFKLEGIKLNSASI